MTPRRPRTYRLAELVERFGGKLIGDGSVRIGGVASLTGAEPRHISFYTMKSYRKQLEATRAGAVILAADARDATTIARIVCDNPYAYFARVSALMNPPRKPAPGVHRTAVVERSARVARSASIGPHAHIGARASVDAGAVIGSGCVIGEAAAIGAETVLHANVSVYARCRLGARCIVHSGAVIGADGFGIAMDDGRWLKVPQIGAVVIGDDVEIGANTTIDRGAVDDTIIEDGVKLDNQIQVGHNVVIGAHTAIAGCVGIAGSARLGRYCKIGGGAIILGHLNIADGVDVSAATLIGKSITTPGQYSGAYPFEAHRAWRNNAAHLRHLDEIAGRIATIEKALQRAKENKT